MSGIKSKKENIEIKGTFRKGRFKIKGNDKFIFQNNLIPICKINYERNYYSLGRLRITIDQNINYISLINNKKNIDEFSVLELKSQDLGLSSYIQDFSYFKETRFSKYCNAIINLELDKLTS